MEQPMTPPPTTRTLMLREPRTKNREPTASLSPAYCAHDLHHVAVADGGSRPRIARHDLAVDGHGHLLRLQRQRLQQRRHGHSAVEGAGLAVQSDGGHQCAGVAPARAASSAARSSRAAGSGEGAARIAEMIATPEAPARCSSGTRSAVTPPMASTRTATTAG